MMLPAPENLAQMFVARTLNSVPEGILIAAFVWLTLRLLPRQNSKTRFAVWLVALVAVAALPFMGALATVHSLTPSDNGRALLSLPDHWALILLLMWISAACLTVLRLGFGVWRLRGLLRSCVPIRTAELGDPAIREVVENFTSSRSVTVATSEKLSVPAAIGITRPIIVIPRWALHDLTAPELNIVLLHEYAHVERWDGWTNLLQKTLRAIFCFHPAVWWIESRLSLEREMACDDYVLAQTNDPHGYGKCLISLLERTLPRKALAMAQAAVHRAHELTLRLAQILDARRAKTRRVWKPALVIVSAFSLLSLAVLPQTRQLVGFTPNDHSQSASAASLPVSPEPALVSANVVPTALHSGSAPIEQKKSNKPISRRSQRRAADNAVILARANKPPMPAEVLPVKADEKMLAPMQAVLVIRTANQIGPNAWQYTIAIWRVSVAPEQAQPVPVFSKKT